MKERIKFEPGIKEIQIKRIAGFKKLQLMAARINKGEWEKHVPNIEMLLSNDSTQFTCYSNLISGTHHLNCFDILSASAHIPALSNETFHTLKCMLPAHVFDTEFEIEMEFEVE